MAENLLFGAAGMIYPCGHKLRIPVPNRKSPAGDREILYLSYLNTIDFFEIYFQKIVV